MKRLPNCLLLFVLAFTGLAAAAQDFSNKGKDFWVGYGYHVRMNSGGGGSQEMVLYFATEAVTNVTVSIPGLGYSATYQNIPANTIFTTNPLPKRGTQDARLMAEGVSDKGIHISSDRPIVAYAHIYDGNVSGATLLFPTNTLGKEYYSVNFDQVSNENRSNCWFYAVAVDTGTTVVQITPSANTLTHPAGQTFTVNLQQGQIVNLMGQLISTGADPYTGVDLTGSVIKSISSGTGGCKRIAVFSGSGKISLTCDGTSSSSDNYIVQAFPKTAWGKRYLTAPTQNFLQNFFRVCVTDPSTVVRFNGNLLTGLKNNFYYQFFTLSPGLIEADKPILVSQYITSEKACGNGNLGDPEVIYLSPVEQNIDKVILNSTANFAISQHFINVVIRSSAVGSFRLDGTTVGGFQPHPQDGSYSFAQLAVGAGKHTLQADSGFNAIAYGYGPAESYGYNAGTNVKDLYQFTSIKNQYATVNLPQACKSSPFYIAMTFPYQPTQIKWIFGQALNAFGIQDVTINSPVYDSTWTTNGKQLFRYSLPTAYVVQTVGTYPIRIVAQNPTPEGCSGEQEIDYDLEVYERPVVDFDFTNSGCLTDSVRFTDKSNLSGQSATRWFWNFGDNKTQAIRNPVHLYNVAGSYPVKFALISDIGCLSDTTTKTVAIAEPPVAKFSIANTPCAGKALLFTDASTAPNSSIAKWTWDFGDGSQKVVATSNASQSHLYTTPGKYTVTLQVESATGCSSLIFSIPVTVAPNPKADFVFNSACLPAGSLSFTNASTISDGSQAAFSYIWNFGDGALSSAKDPVHDYKTVGPFTASLVVTSGAGCKDTLSKAINTIYEPPVAAFSAPAEICLGATASFTDGSSAVNGTLTSWEWNFGDGSPASSQQNPSHVFTKAGTFPVTLKVVSAVGCTSVLATKNVVVDPLPTADFTVSVPACEKANLAFTNVSSATAGNVSKWTWDFGDGSAVSAQSSPVHVYSQPGVYPVKLQVETDKGCVSTVTTKDLVIHPKPLAGFVVPGNCINDPVSVFADTSSIADGSRSQFKWLWNFGDQNATAAANQSIAQNGQHHYTATGDYRVSLTVTSKDGCASSVTQIFTVNGAAPVPQFSFASGMKQCVTDSVVLTNNSFVTPGNLVKLEIYWDYNGDPTNKLVVDKPKKGATIKHQYPIFYSPAEKTVRIKLVIYSGINCLTEVDSIITLKAAPQLQLNAIAPVCANVPAFQLQGRVLNMTGGAESYSGPGVSVSGQFNPSTAGAGQHLVRFAYNGVNGCSNFVEQPVTVFPVPVVSAGPDKVVLEGGFIQLEGSGTGNNLQYLWAPATALNNSTVAKPVTSPVDDIVYTLTVTSGDGCVASDQVLVTVLKKPDVPNAFSPNGDGVHDLWVIRYLDSYPGATVDVFNRYGQKVFESKGYGKPWDGTLRGQPLPVGTYYYLIDPKNGRKPISGFVDIIR